MRCLSITCPKVRVTWKWHLNIWKAKEYSNTWQLSASVRLSSRMFSNILKKSNFGSDWRNFPFRWTLSWSTALWGHEPVLRDDVPTFVHHSTSTMNTVARRGNIVVGSELNLHVIGLYEYGFDLSLKVISMSGFSMTCNLQFPARRNIYTQGI